MNKDSNSDYLGVRDPLVSNWESERNREYETKCSLFMGMRKSLLEDIKHLDRDISSDIRVSNGTGFRKFPWPETCNQKMVSQLCQSQSRPKGCLLYLASSSALNSMWRFRYRQITTKIEENLDKFRFINTWTKQLFSLDKHQNKCIPRKRINTKFTQFCLIGSKRKTVNKNIPKQKLCIQLLRVLIWWVNSIDSTKHQLLPYWPSKGLQASYQWCRLFTLAFKGVVQTKWLKIFLLKLHCLSFVLHSFLHSLSQYQKVWHCAKMTRGQPECHTWMSCLTVETETFSYFMAGGQDT